jgi:hypothetical protein
MTATRHPFSSEELVFHERVTALALQSARPLIWHDVREPWPKRLLGGTCFILRFDRGLVGITASHVVTAYENAAQRGARLVCLLRTVPFDLKAAIIDRDETLDIVTFSVTEDQLIESKAKGAAPQRRIDLDRLTQSGFFWRNQKRQSQRPTFNGDVPEHLEQYIQLGDVGDIAKKPARPGAATPVPSNSRSCRSRSGFFLPNGFSAARRTVANEGNTKIGYREIGDFGCGSSAAHSPKLNQFLPFKYFKRGILAGHRAAKIGGKVQHVGKTSDRHVHHATIRELRPRQELRE